MTDYRLDNIYFTLYSIYHVFLHFFKDYITHTCSRFLADPLGIVVVAALVAKMAESIAAPEPRGDATSQRSPWRFVTDLRQCNSHDA